LSITQTPSSALQLHWLSCSRQFGGAGRS